MFSVLHLLIHLEKINTNALAINSLMKKSTQDSKRLARRRFFSDSRQIKYDVAKYLQL